VAQPRKKIQPRPVMQFPLRIYLAATLLGAFAGLISGAFRALRDQAAASGRTVKALFDALPVPACRLLMLLRVVVLGPGMCPVRRLN
jgi:hypothetical protein